MTQNTVNQKIIKFGIQFLVIYFWSISIISCLSSILHFLRKLFL